MTVAPGIAPNRVAPFDATWQQAHAGQKQQRGRPATVWLGASPSLALPPFDSDRNPCILPAMNPMDRLVEGIPAHRILGRVFDHSRKCNEESTIRLDHREFRFGPNGRDCTDGVD